MNRIMIVGEAFGEKEEELGTPFVGASGHMLNALLRQAGISRDECIITNAFNERPPRNDVESFFTREVTEAANGFPLYAPKTWVRRDKAHHLRELERLRLAVNPNVILALGDTALWALTYQRGIKLKRGTPMLTFDEKHKVIPSWHPAAVLRQFSLRPVLLLDIKKTERESAFPELRRPKRLITYAPTLADIEDFYNRFIVPAPVVSIDIETKQGQITEVGFAPSRDRALVIPFYSRRERSGNYWPTLEAEREAWQWVQRILIEKPTIGQNFQYDMTYLYRTVGITSPSFVGDTMLLHHAMQPELEKGLGFLGSIYTDEPQWKFMRKETLKKED